MREIKVLILKKGNQFILIDDSELEYESLVNTTDTVDDSTNTDESPYTEDELESDPTAPSTSPDDYNSDGEYVPVFYFCSVRKDCC